VTQQPGSQIEIDAMIMPTGCHIARVAGHRETAVLTTAITRRLGAASLR
jgi:hypothetical protein